MPRKKTDEKEVKKKSVITKVVFVLIVIALIGLANFFVFKKDTPDPINSDEQNEQTSEGIEDILGLSSENRSEAEKELTARIQSEVNRVKNLLQTESEKIVTEKRGEVEETVTDFVYDTTIKPIIDKIQSLPENQQDYIKESICTEGE